MDEIGQISSDKVFYTGSYLPNLGIQTNTNLTTILSIMNAIFTNTANMVILKLVSVAGITITSSDLVGRTVQLIVIDGISKNTGFTKATSSPTITFTDDTILIDGQIITIFAN